MLGRLACQPILCLLHAPVVCVALSSMVPRTAAAPPSSGRCPYRSRYILQQSASEDSGPLLRSFIFAGSDTTATTMAFAMYELSRRPELQEEVAREVQQVLAGCPEGEPARQLANCPSWNW